MIKESICHVYALPTAAKYVKQTLIGLKGEINTVSVGDFNSFLSIVIETKPARI